MNMDKCFAFKKQSVSYDLKITHFLFPFVNLLQKYIKKIKFKRI